MLQRSGVWGEWYLMFGSIGQAQFIFAKTKDWSVDVEHLLSFTLLPGWRLSAPIFHIGPKPLFGGDGGVMSSNCCTVAHGDKFSHGKYNLIDCVV